MPKGKANNKPMYLLWRLLYEESESGEVNVRWPIIIGLGVSLFVFVAVPIMMIFNGQAAPVFDMTLLLFRLVCMLSGPALLIFALVAKFTSNLKVLPIAVTGLICCGLGFLALVVTSGLHFS